MQALHADAKRLIAKLDQVTLEHVRREQNKVADGLSNQAMDIVEGKPPVEAPAVAAPDGAGRPCTTHDQHPSAREAGTRGQGRAIVGAPLRFRPRLTGVPHDGRGPNDEGRTRIGGGEAALDR